jgi:hypothetical protein
MFRKGLGHLQSPRLFNSVNPLCYAVNIKLAAFSYTQNILLQMASYIDIAWFPHIMLQNKYIHKWGSKVICLQLNFLEKVKKKVLKS